jgi:hypothetical protein
MGAVLALLAEVISILSSISSIVSNILGLQQTTAQERKPYIIQDTVVAASLNIANPTYGLSALHAQIAAGFAAIPGQIAAALDGYSPVITWPPDAPSWYTAPSSPPTTDDIADTVWSWEGSSYRINHSQFGLSMQQQLEGLWQVMALQLGFQGTPLPTRPWFTLCTAYPDGVITSGYDWDSATTFGFPAEPDWSAWVDGDTPYSFLNRTQPSFGWTLTGPGGANDGRTAWKPQGDPGVFRNWLRSNFTELDGGGQPRLTPPPTITFPPAPPTISTAAHMSIGASHALVDGLVITGPLHGVLVNLTTPPLGGSVWNIGSHQTYYNWGTVGFQSDHGELEPLQFLGWDQGVYKPRDMTVAAAAHFQVTRTPVGTVRPFTLVP